MESLNATLLPLVQKANGFLADYILVFLLIVAVAALAAFGL